MAGRGTLPLRNDALLVAQELRVVHGRGRRAVTAVDGISFDIRAGETLGLVGESGSGKSSALRAILQLPPPTSGSVSFGGTQLTGLGKHRLRAHRRQIQVVLQDPFSSLNPRHRVFDIVAEPLRIWEPDDPSLNMRVTELLAAVGLDDASVGRRFPGQLSGGQQQRVAIARALALSPRLLLCDEAVSSLDVSVRAQVLNLLRDLKARFELTMLFVAHDLAVVRNVSDRIAVMYGGLLCEIGSAEVIFARAAHPYTLRLIESARPTGGSAARADEGPGAAIRSGAEPVPSRPQGCPLQAQCPRAHARCATETPMMRRIDSDHFVACHAPEATS
ncbi:MAG: peptide/nickel transport system ATP-binding protein [Pseudonocardiales bacterium]|jgi:peptide/nickel transport system ATP-binding protein|nr:peptide/nickel transport system ATP-binding protein [Pseudonocardiales bacterium]